MSSFEGAQNILRINDFTQGIVQQGRPSSFGDSGFQTHYPLPAAPGSAAVSARCIGVRGVGLVPFPTYIKLGSTAAPAHVPSSPPTVKGFFMAGPVQTVTLALGIQAIQFPDVMFFSYDYVSGGNLYRSVQRIALSAGTNTVLYETLIGAAGSNYNIGTTFAQTRVLFATTYGMVVVWNDELGRVAMSPDPAAPSVTNLKRIGPPPDFLNSVFCHEGRIVALIENQIAFGPDSMFVSNDNLAISDPPQSITFATQQEFFDIEAPTGYGAWGSMSSGELILIREGAGAVVINGDMIAPSSAIKLPGIQGTGRVRQRGTQSPIGLVYCTEADGAWAWNGGNTSEKISVQIPDTFHEPVDDDSATIGILRIHDCLGNLVFFPNNWVYDCLSRSWWKSEDDLNVINFQVFSRDSLHSRYMWAMERHPADGLHFDVYYFDLYQAASSYFWLSNPLPVTPGELVDIEFIEIVASNPTSTPSTIWINAQPPQFFTAIQAGNTALIDPTHVLNPFATQTSVPVRFTIPPNVEAFRLSSPFGYRDYNIQLEVYAVNSNAANAAPTLHELAIGWRPADRTAGN